MKLKKSIVCLILLVALAAVVSLNNPSENDIEISKSLTQTPESKPTISSIGGSDRRAVSGNADNHYLVNRSTTGQKDSSRKLAANKKFQTWTHSTLLDIRETPGDDGHSVHRVRLVQPPGLPYQVRVEERVKTIPETGETEVSLISETVANRLMFGLAPGISTEFLTPLLEELNAKLKPMGDLPNQYSLHLSNIYMDSALDALALINQQAAGTLVYAELDNMIHLAAVPNDPQYTSGQLWGLNNLGQSQGVTDSDIDGPEAWDKRTDASQVIVAVIDSGVRYTHEDLRANMWVNAGEIPGNGVDDDNNGVVDDVHGFDGINDNGNPDDENGHGTHCAGTIGAVGNNGLGITGVAWKVQIMACRFLNAMGSGSALDSLECINYARSNGAQIMSNSWGGGSSNTAVSNAIEAARQAGILFIAAAGNDGRLIDAANQNFPSSYPLDNVVAVASHTRSDQLSDFSNYGPVEVDIAAPGSDILSCWKDSNSSYKSISGTSMATPHVAGIMAVLKAEFPNDSYTDLIAKLYEGGVASPAYANKISTGKRANLDNSLNISSTRPLLTTRLSNQTLIEEDTLTLTVVATSALPLTYAWRKGNTVITGATTNTYTVASARSTDSGNYTVVVTNADGSVQSSAGVSVLQSRPALATAVDGPANLFASYGDAAWTVLTANSQVGESHVRSGAIAGEQSSSLVTRVKGPGELSFYWKASSEGNYDLFQFYIDGTAIETLSGETAWQQMSRSLTESRNYTLTWIYKKDKTVSQGQDAGFLDGFRFVPEGKSLPVITTHPLPKTVAIGGTATFQVTATGQNPTYQWQKDRVTLTGKTQSTLTISGVSQVDSGVYLVVVSNSAGSVTSNSARLTVGSQQPAITTQPVAGTRNAGTAFTLSVGVSGTAPFQYSWQKNGVDIPGATQASLAFANLAVADSGNYRVKVSNALLPNGVYSSQVNLSVIDVTLVPVISKHPDSRNVASGFATAFSVEVSGDGPFSYQWYKDGTALAGKTQAQLTIASVVESDAGTYTVRVSNSSGGVDSDAAILSVIPNLGDGTDNPQLNWSSQGEALWFIQTAETHDGVDAVQSGAIGDNQFSLLTTSVRSEGIVSFWWKVSSESEWDSLEFFVNGQEVASISGEVDWTLVTYRVNRSSGAELSWLYSKDGSEASGADAGWVDEFSFAAADSGPPLFLAHPRPVAVTGGSDYTFSVDLIGENPISYQWRRNESPINGATDSTLLLTGIDAGDVGNYDVVATNAVGNTVSMAARLSLLTGYVEALNSTGLSFFSESESHWFPQSSVFVTGSNALKSGPIPDNSSSSFSTTVSEPGLISFYWGVVSEPDYDFLQFYFDDLLVSEISGFVDWTPFVYENNLPGEHTFTWVYVKDDGYADPTDAGFVDQVIYNPITFAEAMDSPESQWAIFGASTAMPVTNVSHDGVDAIRLGSVGDNEFSAVETILYGDTTGSFWWKTDSEFSDGLLFYIDEVLQDTLSGDSGWVQVNFSTSGAGAHKLLIAYSKDFLFSEGSDAGWIDEFTSNSLTLAAAVDTTNLYWTTDSTNPWIAQTGETSDSIDAAASAPIGNLQSTSIQALVSGNGFVSFSWKVSSEEGFDELSFFLDGELVSAISGEVDWEDVFVPIEKEGIHEIRWVYSKDELLSSGSDTAFLDQVTFSSITMSEALDNDAFEWESSGNKTWFAQNVVSSDGEDAAQSGPISDLEISQFKTSIDGPFGVTFNWKVSSEDGFDFLAFLVDNEPLDFITGEVDWTGQSVIYNEPGAHVLTWAYLKDDSDFGGLDTGWVDQITITPLADLPPIFAGEARPVLADIGSDVYLNAAVIDPGNTTHQWTRNATGLPGETGPVLRIPKVKVSDAANYASTATNGNGSTLWGPIALSTTTTLGVAVENVDLGWISSGDTFWTAQTTTTKDGSDALQSGAVEDGQTSFIETTIQGQTTLNFWWKVSSEAEFDFLSLYVDGVLIRSISGEVDWTEVTHDIQTSGLHFVRWEYAKDEVLAEGTDAAWVDGVSAVSSLTSTYLSWLAENFSPEDRNNQLLSGENADPDQDNIINLIEYALLLDPLNPSELPKISVTLVNGVPVAQFRFIRRKQPNDLFYAVEFSNNFNNWVPGGNFSEAIVDNQDGTETVTGTITLTTLNNIPLFLRLRITRI